MDLLSYSLEAKEGQVIRRHSQLELKRHRHFFKEAFLFSNPNLVAKSKRKGENAGSYKSHCSGTL